MIDKLARSLFNDLRQALPTTTFDVPEKELRSLLEASLLKMNLVSRQEFDAQQLVLARTREKIDALEKQLQTLTQ